MPALPPKRPMPEPFTPPNGICASSCTVGPWREGTTHRVMSPLQFMQRLAARVPRPRLHQIRFHGVLAPNAKWRAQIVPKAPEASQAAGQHGQNQDQAEPGGAVRLGWARLLRRVFDIDMHHCPNGGTGQLKVVATMVERAVIEKLLRHLGLDPQPPPRAPVDDPQPDQAW